MPRRSQAKGAGEDGHPPSHRSKLRLGRSVGSRQDAGPTRHRLPPSPDGLRLDKESRRYGLGRYRPCGAEADGTLARRRPRAPLSARH